MLKLAIVKFLFHCSCSLEGSLTVTQGSIIKTYGIKIACYTDFMSLLGLHEVEYSSNPYIKWKRRRDLLAEVYWHSFSSHSRFIVSVLYAMYVTVLTVPTYLDFLSNPTKLYSILNSLHKTTMDRNREFLDSNIIAVHDFTLTSVGDGEGCAEWLLWIVGLRWSVRCATAVFWFN